MLTLLTTMPKPNPFSRQKCVFIKLIFFLLLASGLVGGLGIHFASDPKPVGLPLSATTNVSPIESFAMSEQLQRVRKPRARTLADTENHLIVGMDNSHSPLGGRADSIHVLAIDKSQRAVAIVGIPRDVLVDIPDRGSVRVNSVFRVARALGRPPLEEMQRSIEGLLNTTIHSTTRISLALFEKAVDDVGGITIQVQCPIYDNFIDPTTKSGRRILDLDRGTHLIDGKTAALYIRSRHGRSDISRNRRLHNVALGMQKTLRDDFSVLKIIKLIKTARDHLDTNLSLMGISRLTYFAKTLTVQSLHGIVLNHGEVERARTEDGKDVLLLNHKKLERTLLNLFDAPMPGARVSRKACRPKDAATRR